jgi:hypothetical protein
MNYFFKTKLPTEAFKNSLERLLIWYPHVAGRIFTTKDVPGKLCVEHGAADEPGVLFTTATWDAPMSTVLPTPLGPRLTDALPASHPDLCKDDAVHMATMLPVEKSGHVAIAQFTTFTDGCVLAFRGLHCIMDAHAAVVFVSSWAAIYSHLNDTAFAIEPRFDPASLLSLADTASPSAAVAASAKALPWMVAPLASDAAMLKGPLLTPPDFQLSTSPTRQILVSLTAADIKQIQAACTSNVTLHDAVVAFIWTAVVCARADSPETEMSLGIAVGLRSASGSLAWVTSRGSPWFASGLKLAAKDVTLGVAADKIRAVVNSFNDDTIPAMLTVMANSPLPAFCLHVEFGPTALASISWAGVDMYGARFGDAQPMHVEGGFLGVDGLVAVLRASRCTPQEGKWYDERAVVQIGLEAEAMGKFITEFSRMMEGLE